MSDASIRRRWRPRLAARLLLVKHAEKQVAYWTRRRDKAPNPSPQRRHARHMLADRRATLELRRKQVATARRVIARHTPRPQGISENGVALIARFEGFVNHVYRDSVGVETIGYGETRQDIIARYRGGRTISQADALALLKSRIDRDYAPPVLALKLPTQNAIDATVSLVYNLGPGVLGRGHSLGDALRARNWQAAADSFLLYDMAGGQHLPGLTRRRREERSLFLKGL